MKILRTLDELKEIRSKAQMPLGLVPTMGALHEGHLSLIKSSKDMCASTWVSIFVNPTQFNSHDDLKTYPKTIEKDLSLLCDSKVDAVFLPSYDLLYPDDYRYRLSETEISKKLCGKHRPGHFDGVLTVVLKLFNIVNPQKAFFGEKDFQQLCLIQGMVEALFLDVEIVPCPIVRHPSGLAMSSRNQNLSSEAREQASFIHQCLKTVSSVEEIVNQLSKRGFEVDYVEDIQHRRLVAASLEGVRLIDNIEL